MRYTDAGGVRIAYDDEGARVDDAVVFLPGWCNSGRSFFALLAERLAARCRVIRLDWRGHGDSGRPGADFGHDELADDAMAVIEATGVSPVVLVAQAHGGWPAIRLPPPPRRPGDQDRRAELAGPRSAPAGHGRVRDAAGPPSGGGRVSISSWPGGWPGLRKTWPNGSAGRRAAPASTCGRGQRAVTADYARHGNPLRAAADLDHKPDILHLFSQPRAAGFLTGQQEFSAANPWFSVKRLDGATHFPALEIPDVTAAEIEPFAG